MISTNAYDLSEADSMHASWHLRIIEAASRESGNDRLNFEFGRFFLRWTMDTGYGKVRVCLSFVIYPDAHTYHAFYDAHM